MGNYDINTREVWTGVETCGIVLVSYLIGGFGCKPKIADGMTIWCLSFV